MRVLYVLGVVFVFLHACTPPRERPKIQSAQLFLPENLRPQKPPVPRPQSPEVSLPALFQTPISVTFSEDTPLQDIFKTICQGHALTLAIHAHVSGKRGVTYKSFQKPLYRVIDDLCELTGLRARIRDKTVFIEEDTPLVQTHAIAFLLGSRQAQNQVTIMTDVLGNPDGKGGSNSSNTKLSASAVTDFWGELECTLQMILRPPLTLPESAENLRPSLPRQTPPPLPSPSLPPSLNRTVRLLGSPPVRFEEKASGESPVSSKASKEGGPPPAVLPAAAPPPYAFHRQAGLLSVYGTKRQQDLISAYLKRLKKLIHTQITIEAKIVEVLLNDSFKAGIDWHLLSQHAGLQIKSGGGDVRNYLTFGLQGGHFASCLSLMERFGTVRTLSNPHITVLNNQPAIIKVAKNEVFFRLEVDRVLSADNKPDLETTTSQMQTIPIGLVMMVQPSVDPETREVTLTLRPSLSRVVEMRDDPAVSLRSDNKIHSQIPVVQMREMDSVIKIRPQETVILGGLMEESIVNDTTGIPGTSNLPFWQYLFSQRESSSTVAELVIFLRVSLDDA